MQQISQKLLAWYDKNHRDLPWRLSPKALKNGAKPDPYRVWLSEIMLQQTTVEAVKPYFKKFTDYWPDIFALSSATQDDILKAWAGLGYYSRARNLKACADDLVLHHGGKFPKTAKELRSLSGIGDYTAAAIAAIAFNQAIAVVDGNVARIITRVFRIEELLNKAKLIINRHTQDITPAMRPGDFAQAMMDLGATICLPKNPHCLLCPISEFCLALKDGKPERYPVKLEKTKRPERIGKAYIILSKDKQVYLEKRSENGLLGGMTQVPNYFYLDDQSSIKTRYNDILSYAGLDFKHCGEIIHRFTHFTLKLDVYLCENTDGKTIGNGWWCPIADLEKEALPTVMKKVIRTAFPEVFKKPMPLKTTKNS